MPKNTTTELDKVYREQNNLLEFLNNNDKTIFNEQKNGLIISSLEFIKLIGSLKNNAIKIVPVLNESNQLELVIITGKVNKSGDNLEVDGGGGDPGPVIRVRTN